MTTPLCDCPLSSTPFLCPRHNFLMTPEYQKICRNEPLIVKDPETGFDKQVGYDRENYFEMLQDWTSKGLHTLAEVHAASLTPEPTDEATAFSAPCTHLGRDLGMTKCSCGGGSPDKRVPVYQCPVKGRATLVNPIDRTIQNCVRCDSYFKGEQKYGTDAQNRKIVKRPPCRLTFGMAVGEGEEYSAIWATMTSVLEYQPEFFTLGGEMLVVDCSQPGKRAETTARWTRTKPRVENVPTGRYITWSGPDGTAQPRNAVFDYARGDYVICVDPHVILAPGCIAAAVAWLEEHPNDLVMGPQKDDNGKLSWYQRPLWAKGALGVWSGSSAKATGPFAEWQREQEADFDKPFEIWQQGFGFFACRREAWVGFHSDFREWGGCETYAASKFRQAGGRVMCVPECKWRHRFQNPAGVGWKASQRQKLKNYLLGFRDLNLQVEFETCLMHYIPHSGLRRAEIDAVTGEVFATYGPPNWLQGSSDGLTPWQSELLAAFQTGEATV